ncbi:MAG: type II toxin-antitoxin system RelE/ParE family toxin [Bryobacteraceae bacterium]
MAFKIIYTESALADLEAILDYILVDNPAAASLFGNDLLNHVDLLAAFPHIGSPVKRRTAGAEDPSYSRTGLLPNPRRAPVRRNTSLLARSPLHPSSAHPSF